MAAVEPAASRRLALVFSTLRGAGIQRVMLALAGGFVARGLQVDLVVVDARGELRPAVPERARVVDLGVRHSVQALPGLIGYLRRERPDAVLAAQTHINLVTLLARSLSRKPTRVTVSEHVALDAVLEHAATWKERLFPLGARLFYRKADALVVVSHATADRFAATTGLPRNLATVIYNPVVTPDLPGLASQPADHPWFAEGAAPVILSAGRLTPQKDYETLLRAFALVRQQMEARLLILGEGDERRRLEALIDQLGLRRDAALHGFVANPFAYMARARVFALSSRWEGFGNVLVEAMACGTPVVSTDCPSGPAEILQQGAVGPLVPVGDGRALADAILETLRRAPDPAVLRTRAQDFSFDCAVEHYLRTMLP